MTAPVEKPQPLVMAVGGGKGGVGKSMVSANLAVQYAQAGMRVTLLDLDFGAANLHTLFGQRHPSRGLGNYFRTPRAKLDEFLLPTSVDNLLLGAGSGFVPELTNLKHSQKTRIMRQIQTLEADLVLLDLGAGSTSNVVDFFSICHTGVVVTTPEPTAVVNAYEFLKNVVYRILFKMLRNQPELLKLLRTSVVPGNSLEIETVSQLAAAIESKSSWVAELVRSVCADMNFYLVFNQARKASQANLGQKLQTICQRYLDLNLHYAGMVYHNAEVSNSVFRMSPLSVQDPDSVTSRTLRRIAIEILQHTTGSSAPEELAAQLARVSHHAEEDYTENHLTQLRIRREREEEATLEATPR